MVRTRQAANLSPFTVTARVESLTERGYVHEKGLGESRGGRRPRELGVRADACVVGCADLDVNGAWLGHVVYALTQVEPFVA